MKPAPNTLEREDTLPVLKRIEFGIGDPRALMRINAKQYSDITTAIIREYSTNAYDAHIMAGHSDPIEVSLPSLLDTFFVVRDHGVGMNMDTFEQIYTQFGTSDKTERTDANGQMGIGSKSGVAYTTQFTVTSVKDGIKTEARVSREADWTLVMDVLTEEFTDEPNGTVIRIPVHNVDEFRHKAHEFYKFWQPGRVLIDGEPSVHHVGQKIAENLYFSKDWYKSYVVMANVAYRIENPEALFRDSKLGHLHFVAYVDELAQVNGSAPIDFTPSREDLEYSDLTKNTLRGIIHKFETDLITTAQDEVNNASTHAEAYTAWAKWRGTLNGNIFGDLTFQGEKFRSNFPVIGYRYRINSSRNSVRSIREWGVEEVEKTLFVTGFNITVSSVAKSKAKEYLDLVYQDNSVTHVLFTEATSFDSVWVDWSSQKVVSWADLKATLPKKPRSSNGYVPGSGRIPGSWDYYEGTLYHSEKPIPTDKDVYHISLKMYKRLNVSSILKLLGSDAVVLIVPANRLAKLTREFPQVKPFIEWAKSQVVLDGASLLGDDAKKTFGIDYDTKSWLERLDMGRVNDPDLVTAKCLLANQDELLAEYNRHQYLANQLCLGYNGFNEYRTDKHVLDFYGRYPLLRHISRYGRLDEDVYLYMDAKLASLDK